MTSFKQHLVFIFSLGSFGYTIYAVLKFLLFLSKPQSIPKVYTWVFNLLDNKSRLETAYKPILVDTLLLLLFVFQHSFMTTDFIKKIWNKIGLPTAERSIYSVTSSLCLQFIVNHWVAAQSIVLWQVDVENSPVLWWCFTIVHGYAWLIILGGSLTMDLPEMVGIKQAYLDCQRNSVIKTYEEVGFRRVLRHVRHPTFIGLSLVLWVTNLMTIDRLLIAIILSTYLYCAWSTNRRDYIYHKRQYRRRMTDLKLKQTYK